MFSMFSKKALQNNMSISADNYLEESRKRRRCDIKVAWYEAKRNGMLPINKNLKSRPMKAGKKKQMGKRRERWFQKKRNTAQ